MKCDLYLVCRPTLRHLAPYVPPEFSFLLSALKDEPERSYAPGHSNGMVRNLDPALVDPLIEWGRQEWRGATLIDAVRIYEVYEPEDLVDSPVLELFKAPGAPTRYISNFDGAIQHFWACEYCTRFTTRQVKDLNVRPGRGPEVQWTWQAHLIVAARVRELLAAAGVATRPLLKNSAYFQALPVDRIEMRADLHPLQPGERCPGCGEQTVHRTDWVEGPIPNNTRGLAIRRHEYLLTIVPPAEPVSLAYGWPYLNSMVGVVGEPVHRVGERIFNLGRWFHQHDMAYLASRDLVLELVRQNVTGIGYRPVKVQQQ